MSRINRGLAVKEDIQKIIMNTLPDDLLCRCLARVPLADRVPAERVCKGWRTAFASRAYTVARRACAEPAWLVVGGRDGTGRVLDQCHMLDVSLRKVAQLAPRHSASAGSAVIPGLGVLVMGGYDEAQQRRATAWVHDLQAGSTWRHWADLPAPCGRPSLCALGESIYVDCIVGPGDDRQSHLLRYDKQGNLLETIQKPAAIRRPLGDAPVVCAINGRLFMMTRVDEHPPVSYRMDSYDPATGAWQRMPDPPVQAFGLNLGAVAHAGKLYAIGGTVILYTGGKKLSPMVRVFDGQDWSVGPQLPSPAVCDFAVSSAGGILAVADYLKRAYVLHNGTWHSHSCEETELLAFPKVVPL